MRVLAIVMLCLPVLALGAMSAAPDADPTHWQKISLQMEGRAIGFAIPHRYRVEGGDPRRRSLAFNDHSPTEIFDAQYEFGNGWGWADVPQFTVFFMLRPYSENTAEEIANFKQIAASPDEVPTLHGGALYKAAKPGTGSEVVKVGDRSWVLLRGPKGANSYAIPFTKTHAFFVIASFFSKTPHNEDWYEARRRILRDIVRSVTITKATSPNQ